MGTLLNRIRYMGYVEPVNEEGYDGGYLTLTVLQDTTFTFRMGSSLGTGNMTGIYYSLDDGATWVYTQYVALTTVDATTPLIHKGEHVLWKGVNKRPCAGRSPNNYSVFLSDGLFAIGGTLQSLIWGDEYETKLSVKDWNSFVWLFYQSKLKNAKNLRLTATTLLPGTYHGLFDGCSYLEVPPSKIEIGADAYQQMFTNCTSLKSSPDILIPTLASNSLKLMFNGCTSLKYIKILSTNISATDCLQNWVQNVPAGGTFVKAAGVTYPSGASGIPNGWTVEEVTV